MGFASSIKQWAETTKIVLKGLKKAGSPKAINAARANISNVYKECAESGIFRVAQKESAHPKIAQMAADLESMLEHPLAKKGLSPGKNPKIFISGGDVPTAHVLSDEVIMLSDKAIEICSAEELRGIIGHELAHIVRGDMDASKGMPKHKAKNQGMENSADRLGVILSGNPQAVKSALEKVQEGITSGTSKLLANIFEKRPFFKKLVVTGTERQVKYGNRTYPPLRTRLHHLDKIAEQLSTPAGRSFAETEEMRRLEDIHGKSHGR